MSRLQSIFRRTSEIIREHAVSIPKKLYQSLSLDLAAVRRSLLVNTGRDVILLYGYYGTIYELLPLASFLSDHGYKVHLPHYDSTKKTATAASAVKEYIEAQDLKSYSFVGHSKGGIIAKYLVYKYQEIFDNTKKIITIATPHNGSIVGFLPFPNGFELRTGSKLIKTLQKKEIEEKIVAICNKLDLVIVPGSNQKVTFGKNIDIDVWGHTNISTYKKTLETVLDELK